MLDLFVLALIAGLGGVCQALDCYIPAVLVGMIDTVARYFTDREHKLRLLQVAVIAFAGNLIGVLINNVVLARSYSFLNQSSFKWEELSINNFAAVISDLLVSYGLCFNDVQFMGVYGVVNFLACSFIVLLLTGVTINCSKLREADDGGGLYLVFALTVTLFDGFVFSCCMGDYLVTYWIPIMPLLYPLPVMAVQALNNEKLNRVSPYLFCYVAITFLLVSHVTLKNPYDGKLDFMPQGKPLAATKDVLEELPDKGYAPFWIGNCITELINREKEVWAVDDHEFTTLGMDEKTAGYSTYLIKSQFLLRNHSSL